MGGFPLHTCAVILPSPVLEAGRYRHLPAPPALSSVVSLLKVAAAAQSQLYLSLRLLLNSLLDPGMGLMISRTIKDQ